LAKMVDTNDEWILERTGIKQRHISSPEGGEFSTDLGVKAAQNALDMAKMSPDDIDFVLCATGTADFRLPNNASIIQQKLGMTNECPCLDISAACSGYVYGMVLADSMIKTGLYKNILVLGAEMLSPWVDWDDRGTCILFSDGAGAAILAASDGADQSKDSTILHSILACDGSGGKYLNSDAGGCVLPSTKETIAVGGEKIRMEGRQVFKYATRTMIANATKVLQETNLTVDDVDWVVPHQANLRIIEYIAKKIEVPMEKVIVTVDKYGNNSAATVPIAFDEAVRDGRIKRGDLVLMDVFGGGVTSGALLMRY
jgi:3-oxoacyl-[acyl-carrier-protein] synthase-3